MIIVQVKQTSDKEQEKDDIEKALKIFKKKVDRVKILKQVKSRRYYIKPSIKRREEKLKAIYKQQKQQAEL